MVSLCRARTEKIIFPPINVHFTPLKKSLDVLVLTNSAVWNMYLVVLCIFAWKRKGRRLIIMVGFKWSNDALWDTLKNQFKIPCCCCLYLRVFSQGGRGNYNSPQSFIIACFISWLNNFGDLLNLVGCFIKLSVQKFQPSIVILING